MATATMASSKTAVANKGLGAKASLCLSGSHVNWVLVVEAMPTRGQRETSDHILTTSPSTTTGHPGRMEDA